MYSTNSFLTMTVSIHRDAFLSDRLYALELLQVAWGTSPHLRRLAKQEGQNERGGVEGNGGGGAWERQ